MNATSAKGHASQRVLVHVLSAAESGGCERACDHLCLYGEGVTHKVVVLNGPGPMTSVWEHSGAEVHHLRMIGVGRKRLAKKLRGLLEALQPDALIAWHGMAELPVILNSVPEGCVKVAVHGGNPASSLSLWTDLRYLWVEHLVFPRKCKPVFLCCSQYVADTFRTSRYLNRFEVAAIRNGVYILPEEKVHVPRILPNENGEILLGMLARLDTIKDHATVIRAMVEIKKSYPEAILELAGDGGQLRALEALTESLGLTASVRFLGMVHDISLIMARWDVCLYATTKDEGFGIALAEGLMAGLPTIVTDIGPVREVCSADGLDAVRYVHPHRPEAMAKAVLDIIPDFETRKRLAATARTHAMRNLSGRVFAQRYMDILFHKD